jgi:hypothetical protein
MKDNRCNGISDSRNVMILAIHGRRIDELCFTFTLVLGHHRVNTRVEIVENYLPILI